MALTNATTLADYGSGIGTQGATLKVDANNQRVGIGSTLPTTTLDVTGDMAVSGNIAIAGTVTYEDLTNVDAIGLSTFRAGIHVTGGSVGIGTNDPTNVAAAGARDLVIGNNSTSTAGITINTGTGSYQGRINFGRGTTDQSYGYILCDHFNAFMSFGLSNTGEKLRIDSSGNVGIGTDNPSVKLHLSNSGATQMMISNTSSSMPDGDTIGTIDFTAGPNHTTNARVAGLVEGTSEAGGDLVFETRADGGSLLERLRITSSGQVLIDSTSTTGGENGKLKVRNDVDYSSTEFEDNATLCLQNETNSNFATILFHSNNSGGSSGRSIIAGGATGSALGEIHFWADASNDTSAASRDVRISPNTLYVYGSEGVSAALHLVADEGDDNGDTWRLISNQDDNDLTISNNVSGSFADKLTIRNDGDVRINDGNLVISTSGHGIDFSATSDAGGMTSELLDDYEEGTWTPSLSQTSVNPTVTYTTDRQKGRYTKIGNVVTIWFDVDWSSLTGGSGDPVLGGLPYNVVAGTTQGGYGAPQFRDASGVSANFRIYGNSSYFSNPSYIYLRQYDSSGNEEATTFNSSGRLTGWGQYFTNNAY